jgi:hypothetical protein
VLTTIYSSLNWLNIKANEASKITKNSLGKHVYSIRVHLFTLFSLDLLTALPNVAVERLAFLLLVRKIQIQIHDLETGYSDSFVAFLTPCRQIFGEYLI